MAETMLEKMARALSDADGVFADGSYQDMARAALMAIREIDPGVMLRVQWGRVPEKIQDEWADVIDAILSGEA